MQACILQSVQSVLTCGREGVVGEQCLRGLAGLNAAVRAGGLHAAGGVPAGASAEAEGTGDMLGGAMCVLAGAVSATPGRRHASTRQELMVQKSKRIRKLHISNKSMSTRQDVQSIGTLAMR